MHTQVGIVGAGPAGLLLSHLLHLQNIESIVIENCSRAYVERRVRAGVLEQGSVNLLMQNGLGERMQREGLQHHGIELRFDNKSHRINFDELTGGKGITVYGQQEIVIDLIAARLAAGGEILFEVDEVSLHNLEDANPYIEFQHDGEQTRISCDFIIGCDGFHGISRPSIPVESLKIFERSYPFSWLGILVEAPPSSEELIYASSPDGFALHSMRSTTVTRNYIQCSPDDVIDQWSDDKIWHELHRRLEIIDGWQLKEGKVLEKGITPMRSFVCETMQYGKLFLAGDAAHIVPPTGAKGMNLAISDVNFLSLALAEWYLDSKDQKLTNYSEDCLRRVWRGEHFSWWMTSMLHRFPEQDGFQQKLQTAELNYVCNSAAASASLAENYVGYHF